MCGYLLEVSVNCVLLCKCNRVRVLPPPSQHSCMFVCQPDAYGGVGDIILFTHSLLLPEQHVQLLNQLNTRTYNMLPACW